MSVADIDEVGRYVYVCVCVCVEVARHGEVFAMGSFVLRLRAFFSHPSCLWRAII